MTTEEQRLARRRMNRHLSKAVHCEECGETLGYEKGSIRWSVIEDDRRSHLCPCCRGSEIAQEVLAKMKPQLDALSQAASRAKLRRSI